MSVPVAPSLDLVLVDATEVSLRFSRCGNRSVVFVATFEFSTTVAYYSYGRALATCGVFFPVMGST
jgi:hypothetical protein